MLDGLCFRDYICVFCVEIKQIGILDLITPVTARRTHDLEIQ